MKNIKEDALEWINSDKPCYYRFGFGFRGASSKRLTKSEALAMLPKYKFGMGFYELSFCKNRVVDEELSGPNCIATKPTDEDILLFNEFSADDMW